MKLKTALTTCAVTVLALAGCSPESPATVEPTATRSSDAAVASSASVAHAAVDDYKSCGLVGKRLEDTQTVVEQIVADGSGATLDWALLEEVATDLHAADSSSSPKMQGYLAPYAGVIFTLEAIQNGTLSGSQNLDTGGYRDSVATLLSYCVNEVGWVKTN